MFEMKNDISLEDDFSTLLSKSEPTIISLMYESFVNEKIDVSFDSVENKKRLHIIEEKYRENIEKIYESLTNTEKILLEIMNNSFGWLVYDSEENLFKLISKFFDIKQEEVKIAVKSLLSRFMIFKCQRLNYYNYLFLPPMFVKHLKSLIKNANLTKEDNSSQENLIETNYLQLIAGLISYVVNFSPRSSENNEVHKIDFDKLLEFFSDFSDSETVTKIVKRLSKFGFFQKINNRIVINKFLFDSISNLSINEQFFIIFLYDFLDQFGFYKPAFLTLKILASYCYHYKKPMKLKELFFYYLNSHFYFFQKVENHSFANLIKHEEIKFMIFVKQLEHYRIVKIISKNSSISLMNDELIMNEPMLSILNNIDLSAKFSDENFIVESNYEVIVEPNLKPQILFKLALFTEPKTIQTISIFKITKDSLKKSLLYGLKKDEILEFLKKHSLHKIPENVEQMIKASLEEVKYEEISNYKIIQINANYSNYIREKYKNLTIEVEPHTFLIFEEEIKNEIENYCNENKIPLKYINDFLSEKYYKYITNYQIEKNIKHLHTIKDFFDFYGTQQVGTIIKIENKI